ncbi:hypothetical protein [Saccharothrix hoggarensis]|uniref:Ig-like domain-containing protein n=1 Tax=Saccharothrix hoggarensis TaxID=913853 RepID=A0ABW3QMU0_9PSEU
MRSRTVMAGLLTTAATVLGLMAFATPATAGALDVTCLPTSSQTASFSPPLTLTPGPTTVTASTQYGPCTSTSVPELTSGSRSATITYPALSCLDLVTSAPLTFTITWNTGQTSTISGSTTVTTAGAALVVTITGNVTAGLFAGDSVVQTITGPSTAVTLCTLGMGTVPSIYGVVALSITSTP